MSDPKENASAKPVGFQYRLEYAALILIKSLLGLMGVDRASAFMGQMWRWFAPLNKRHARAMGHLRRSLPGRSDAEYNRIIGDMWENLGRVSAETLLLDKVLADPRRIEHRFDEQWFNAHRDSGVVFISLHGGNWELTAVAARTFGFRVNAIYRTLKNPLSDAFLYRMRKQVYTGKLMARSPGIAMRMRGLARAGDAVALLADLDDENSMVLDFLGYPAKAALFPAMLARRLKLPILIGRSLRLDGVRFRIEGYPLEIPYTDDIDADIRAITIAIHAQFEAWIRETPAQWMWAHRKWLDDE